MPFIQRWPVQLPLGLLFATPLMLVTMVVVQKLEVEGALEDRSPRPADEGA